MDTLVRIERDCPLCDGQSHTIVRKYTHPSWPLASCNDCGFVFLQQVPTYADLSDFLSWESSFSNKRAQTRKTIIGKLDALTRVRTRLGKSLNQRQLSRIIGSQGNVLEIGCGPGTSIPLGCTPYGIEIGATAAQTARPIFEARSGRVLHSSGADGITEFPDEFFSAVLMRSYLEHEAQPLHVLRHAARTLRKDGKIYIRVPNYGSINRHVAGRKWCGFRFPDHVNYFTSSSLQGMAERVGLSMVRLNRWSLFDDNILAILVKPS